MTRGPYENTLKLLAKCVRRIKREKGEVRLSSHQLHRECDIPYRTAVRYVDSSVAEEYQRELNLELKKVDPNTQVKRVCERYGVEVDDPPERGFNPLGDVMELFESLTNAPKVRKPPSLKLR